MQKLLDGVVVDLTQAEVDALNLEIAEYEAARPMREWYEQMQALDAELTADVRMLEDLLDWAVAAGYTPPAGSKVTAAIAKRKAHRSTRP